MAGRTPYSLLGEKFGKLTVVGESRDNKGKFVWECKCECGNTTFTDSYNLMHGRVMSCGCVARNKLRPETATESNSRWEDITGKTFGQLTVIEQMPKYGSGRVWKVQCACGNIAHFFGYELKKIEHCGCKDGAPRDPKKLVYQKEKTDKPKRKYVRKQPKIEFNEAIHGLSAVLMGETTDPVAKVTVSCTPTFDMSLEVDVMKGDLEKVAKTVFCFLSLIKERGV